MLGLFYIIFKKYFAESGIFSNPQVGDLGFEVLGYFILFKYKKNNVGVTNHQERIVFKIKNKKLHKCVWVTESLYLFFLQKPLTMSCHTLPAPQTTKPPKAFTNFNELSSRNPSSGYAEESASQPAMTD